MAIIISENGKNAKRVEESNFALEDKLQQYIYDNPDAIPLYDIDQDTRLFIAAREFSTKSGPIDALGFDRSGNIYVVETKLYKNPDKRTVVAQALDYGASLWRHAVDFDAFLVQLDIHCQKQFGQSFSVKYADFFELEDATDNINAIKSNLANGSIKFVVLMDKLHDALKDLVIFVNQNSKFDLYAVELEYYRHKSFEIVIPKLYGAEVRKDVVSKSKGNAEPWTESNREEFIKDVDKRHQNDEFSQVARDAILKLDNIYTKITEQVGGNVSYYRRPATDDIRFFANDTGNKIFLLLDTSCRVEGWPGKRTGAEIDFVKSLEEEMISNKLFGRTEMSKSSWGINFRKDRASDAEISKFLQINKKAFENLKI